MCNLTIFFLFFFLIVLDSSKIARDAINKVIEICRQWSSELPSFHKSKITYESYAHAIKNTRRKMEDRHVILPEFNCLFGFPQVIFTLEMLLLFNLLSWTQLNFAGKTAVNAWDRSWVGTKCSHTVHVCHNIVLGHACSCSASRVCNKCKLDLTAEVYFIFCGMIEVWVFLVILSNRIYTL